MYFFFSDSPSTYDTAKTQGALVETNVGCCVHRELILILLRPAFLMIGRSGTWLLGLTRALISDSTYLGR